jgi:hypothetical protein
MTTEERLETLEKELALTKRRIRRLLQGVVCLFAAGCVFAVLLSNTGSAKVEGTKIIKIIRANEFILEDQNGKSRAFLSINNGWPRLMMTDQNEKVRTILDVGEHGPGLALLDQKGNVRTLLSVETYRPYLRMADGNGNVRTRLSVEADGPSLEMYDQNGNCRATVGTNQTSTPDGKTISFTESSIRLFGPDGKGIWAAP